MAVVMSKPRAPQLRRSGCSLRRYSSPSSSSRVNVVGRSVGVGRGICVARASAAAAGGNGDGDEENGEVVGSDGIVSSEPPLSFAEKIVGWQDLPQVKELKEKNRLLQRQLWQVKADTLGFYDKYLDPVVVLLKEPGWVLSKFAGRVRYILWCMANALFIIYQRSRWFTRPLERVGVAMAYWIIAREVVTRLPQSLFWYFFLPNMFIMGGDPGFTFKPLGIVPINKLFWSLQERAMLYFHTRLGIPYLNIAYLPSGMFYAWFYFCCSNWAGWVLNGGRPFFGGYTQAQVEMAPLVAITSGFLGFNGFVSSLCTFLFRVTYDVDKFINGENNTKGERIGVALLDQILDCFGIQRTWERRHDGWKRVNNRWRIRLGSSFWLTNFPEPVLIREEDKYFPELLIQHKLMPYTRFGRTYRILVMWFKREIKFMGTDGVFDLIFPKDMSMTMSREYIMENDVGHVWDHVQTWPPRKKMTQNNIVDKIWRAIYPPHM